MKTIKVATGLFAFYVLFIGFGTQFSSCTKPLIVYDTVKQTVNYYDTVINTVTINDTLHSAELKEGLVAYFPFKNGSLNDFSGYDNNIAFNNAQPTTGKAGTANSAYQFNGVNNYMRIRNSSSLNPQNISIMTVVKVNDFNTATCHGNQIIGKGYPDPVRGFYFIRYTDYICDKPTSPDLVYFSAGFGDNVPRGSMSAAGVDTVVVKKATWYTLIYTYNGIESRIYLNGVLKDARVRPANFTPNANDIFIGRSESPEYPYYFNGIIDEIRMYNRALTASQVQQLTR